jgi:hypothetical protein
MVGRAVGRWAKTDSYILLSYRRGRGIRNTEFNTVHMLDARWVENARGTKLYFDEQ